MLAAPFANEWIGERVTVDGNGASDPAARVLDEWRNAAYNCFSSGHKFCREVCPVLQVTHDETHSPTAFHANVVAMEKGLVDDRRRGGGLRQLHAVRRLRAALPEHHLRRRLLPLPHAHGRPREGDAHPRRRQRHPPAGVGALEPADRRAEERAGAGGRVAGARGRLGGRARHSGGRRDDPVLRLRGGVLPHVAAQGGGEAAAGRRRGVRPDARAVVLRRAGGRDGLRRAGAALRRAQRRRLARGRREAHPRARPARLHHVHRGLPEVLRRRLRLRDRARDRAGRRADPRRPARR